MTDFLSCDVERCFRPRKLVSITSCGYFRCEQQNPDRKYGTIYANEIMQNTTIALRRQIIICGRKKKE